MPWAMAKHSLFLVIALMLICVSSLAIPPDDSSPASRTTRAPSHPSHASPAHHGNKTTPSTQQDPKPQPNSVALTPAPTAAVKAVAASPAKPHRPTIPPILVILSILFGTPLLAFLVVTLALSCCRRRHPEPKQREITLNTWDIFRKDRHAVLQAAKHSQSVSPSSPGRRAKLAGIGLGLGLDMDPSAPRVIRHTPRRPSPLRQVYTAAETPAVLSEFGSANSLPRSALHYYRSPASPASTAASPSPRTPGMETIIPVDAHAKHRDEGTELDIADAYDPYFVLGEDEVRLIGTACW